MSKIISFDREAKEKLKSGIDQINKAVAVTMGPFGRNVLIEKEYGQVSSTKDGVSVAKMIELEDPIENMAATVIKQAAIKTVEQAGDGTTTSTILAHSIATQALDITSYNSINITQVKRGIEEATREVVESLRKQSKNIESESQIKQIAVLSANGDQEIGTLVSTAMDKVGRDGIIAVEESRTGETTLEVVEGMQFDRGYKSHHMVTDTKLMLSILDKPLILFYDGKISTAKELLPILNHISNQNNSLLVIAEDIDNEALATLIVNQMRGTIKVAAVKAPGFGESRTLLLEDMAALTGGVVISSQKGMRLEKFDKEWFGLARTATISKDTTTIIDGKGEDEDIKTRVTELKDQIDKSKSSYEIERLQDRLGKLIGGVAIINIGGGTEIYIKERKDRVEDALQATRAALDEGIIPGAGVALLHAKKSITNIDNSDFGRGKNIIAKACSQPFKQILLNAGEEPEEYNEKIQSDTTFKLVPEIGKHKIIDAYKNGIIDPTKVVRCALQNASAAAITLLLTECVIHEKPSDKKKEEPDYSQMM